MFGIDTYLGTGELRISKDNNDYSWWGINFSKSVVVRSFFVVIDEDEEYTDNDKRMKGLVGDTTSNPCAQSGSNSNT
jgi:hypothetical protein